MVTQTLNINFLFTGGYYSIEQTTSKLRIIAINTNLYSSQYEGDDPASQWAWLESVLAKSNRNKETVSNLHDRSDTLFSRNNTY